MEQNGVDSIRTRSVMAVSKKGSNGCAGKSKQVGAFRNSREQSKSCSSMSEINGGK